MDEKIGEEVPSTPDFGGFKTAGEEKEWVARTSVGAAIFLTTTKAVVGFSTGSLGIMSEALHSALDLMAAIITWFTVRFSGKPADEDHQYGHGKAENLSALAEIILLLITCFWIVLEAVERLSGKHDLLEVTFWSFAVMIVSIVVDVSRSRALYKVAAKHHSQALEADALHFSSDVLSSLVVIVGLIFSAIGHKKADPLAALGVALLVVVASLRLGRSALDSLMDKAPRGMNNKIREVSMEVDGVIDVKNVRVRGAGHESFADITVTMARNLAFEEAHGISHQVEKAIRQIYPNCVTQIHMEPIAKDSEDLFLKIRRTALCQQGVVNLHNLELLEDKNFWFVTLHIEVDESMSISQAHKVSSDLEGAIKTIDPRIFQVFTHIEPALSSHFESRDVTEFHKDIIPEILEMATGKDLQEGHNLRIISSGNQLNLEMHVRTKGETKVTEAHRHTSGLEESIRKKFPQFAKLTIHVEPLKDNLIPQR